MADEHDSPVSPREVKREAKIEAAAEKARAKAERPFWKKKRFIIPAVLTLVVVVVAVGAGDDTTRPELVTDDPEARQAADEAEAAADAAAETQDDAEGEVVTGFGIGDTVAMGDLRHTLHGARFSDGDQFMSPDEGTRWLVVDVEVENTSDQSQAMSSMMMWRLVDADNRTRDMTITTDERGSMDGELGAGRSMRGEIAYQVDADQTQWELIFEPRVFGFGQAVYSFTADEVQ